MCKGESWFSDTFLDVIRCGFGSFLVHFPKTADMLQGYSTQNDNFVIIHLPTCRSNSIKASFVFGAQFKIF